MHKYEVLRRCAEEFRLQLEKYAKEDLEHKSELEWFIQQWMPWHKKVMCKEIRLPCYEAYGLGIYFTNPDLSKMAETYHYINPSHPLNRASSQYFCAVADRYSDPRFIADLRASGESLDLIPDEYPPPEEEAPLPTEEGNPQQAEQGWLYRWIFESRKK
jgi:hypothetical protein